MKNLPSSFENEETSLIESGNSTGTRKKYLRLLGPVLIFLVSFVLGFVYFINIDSVARYFILKQGLPLEIDNVGMTLSGRFEIERVKYDAELKKGLNEEIKVEYAGGTISLPSLILSNRIIFNVNLRGVKIPLPSGQISGGSWKIKAIVENIGKNVQQWSGDVELTVENAMVQIKAMESNYVANIKSGIIRGKIKNGTLELDNTDILSDIAKITVSGNSGITNPYNVNVDLRVLPLDEFGVKYPNEKSMLSALMQKESDLVISLTGPLANLHPHLKNINIPGF